jgi:hypothetical protein
MRRLWRRSFEYGAEMGDGEMGVEVLMIGHRESRCSAGGRRSMGCSLLMVRRCRWSSFRNDMNGDPRTGLIWYQ